jgi:RNA polymerase sigma-70 factor (ECF subfamily)
MTFAPKPAAIDSDEYLLRRHIDGDTRAFEELLERYRQPVVNLVRSRLGHNSPWLEDVAQDVFLQLHRSARSFECRSTFKTWLFRLTLNVCRDHLRRERRNGDVLTQAVDDSQLDLLPCDSLSPLEMLERTERETLIRGAIQELGPMHRVILQLRDLEELTYDDIAEVLDVPAGTVRSRLHNARVALAKSLSALFRRT